MRTSNQSGRKLKIVALDILLIQLNWLILRGCLSFAFGHYQSKHHPGNNQQHRSWDVFVCCWHLYER